MCSSDLEYLKANRLAYREDASNADSRFLRNRIRHELLPLLEREYNPAIRAALCRTAEIIRAELAGEPVAAERRAVRRLSFQQVEELRRATRRKPVTRLAGEWPVNLAGLTEIPELGLHLETASAGGERFDAGKLGPAPTIRTWRDGDRFQPLGMTGEKKLQDFFVDKKIPRPQRHRVPLLCATDGRIAWVVGYRIAEPFKVTPGTSKVICFTARVTTT